MSVDSDRLVVITGGPGSGKSTLIAALSQAGFHTSEEVGRKIIQQQVVISGHALPWGDPLLFAEMMLSWEMESYRALSMQSGFVFFDRGVPDVIGYLHVMGLPIPDHITKAAEAFRYNCLVFIAPPWPEIFAPDSERKQTIDEAEQTYRAMIRTYADYGYDLVELPRAPVEMRLQFVVESGVLARATPA